MVTACCAMGACLVGRVLHSEGRDAHPRPHACGPPITIGGNGGAAHLPLAAKFASEWNCFWRTSSSGRR